MYEELLRSFEEDAEAERRTSDNADQDLALFMPEVLSDEDDKDSRLPESLLYRIFAGGGRHAQPKSQATYPGLGRYSPSAAVSSSSALATGSSKTVECQGGSHVMFPSFTDNDHLVRPHPPSPPEDCTDPSVSENSLLPSASVTLNSSLPPGGRAPLKQTDLTDIGGQVFFSAAMKSSVCLYPSSETNQSCCVEDKRGNEENSGNVNRGLKETELLGHSPNQNVLSFGLLAEACKEFYEPMGSDETESDMPVNTVTEDEKNKHPKSICTTHIFSPPCVAEPRDDRICSDKRIPLPEEILMAVNRALELGELRAVSSKAQGDNDALKTCPRVPSDTGTDGVISYKAQANKFPVRSSKFPLREQSVVSQLRPLSYFKLSSCNTRSCEIKHLNHTDLENAFNVELPRSEDSVNSDPNGPALRSINSDMRRGPLYRKDCLRAEERRSNRKKKAAAGSETLRYPLSTPPNSPIRSKAGITFSDPIATCVNDCNSNMAVSGRKEDTSSSRTRDVDSKPGEGCPDRTLKGQSDSRCVQRDRIEEEQVKLVACPTNGPGGDKADYVVKPEGSESISDTSKVASSPLYTGNIHQRPSPKPSLNSHPSILLKPREYLEFYNFLKSKKPVKKEVRRPKTKIFKLQRMMTGVNGGMGEARPLLDPDKPETNAMPVFPRGREVPPGWQPGQHGSHPITQISAEYGIAAQNSSRSKKHTWKKTKVRRKAPRSRENKTSAKQSASETSVELSPVRERVKRFTRHAQDSSDDMALVTNSEFEHKRQFYERQQRSKAAPDNGGGKSSKRTKPTKVTEQVNFLKTIDDICNAEEEWDSDEDSNKPLTEHPLASSLAKYYSKMMTNYISIGESEERNNSLGDFRGVRIASANLNVPSTISLDRLRAIRPPSPQGMYGGGRWPSRAHHSNPNLPASSAKWPESSMDVTGAQVSRKQPRKSSKAVTDWINPGKIAFNSDYREAWDQLRANYVEVKNAVPQTGGDHRTEAKKKDAREEGKRSPGKAEKNGSQKKTTAAKVFAGLKEKSSSFKLKQVTKLPAPPDRSEEDTWCYSVNAMLLKAKQVMADSQDQKKGTHRFPRHNSAAVVSPVIEQKATSNFLKTLLKQDAEELRQKKVAGLASNDAVMKQQRARIRNVVGKIPTRKTFSTGRTINNSCNVDSVSPTESCTHSNSSGSAMQKEVGDIKRSQSATVPADGQQEASQISYSPCRIHKPLGLRHPGNRATYQKVRFSPRKTVHQENAGQNYVFDQTLSYFDYPFITDSSIVPLFGNTNTNALSGDRFEEDLKQERDLGIQATMNGDTFFSGRNGVHLRWERCETPYDGCTLFYDISSNCTKTKHGDSYFSSKKTKRPQKEVSTEQLSHLPATRSILERNTFDINRNKNALSSKGYHYETLNQSVLLEGLLDLEKTTHVSKQCAPSDTSSTFAHLAEAKAKADAAYEAFLAQRENPERIKPDTEPNPIDAYEKSVPCDKVQEAPENLILNSREKTEALPNTEKQSSNAEECSLSTRTCNSSIINMCAEVNTLPVKKVYRSCLTKRNNASKKIIKQGRFPFGQPFSARPELPLVIFGSQKEVDLPEIVRAGQNNFCFRGHITGASKSSNAMRSSFKNKQQHLNSNQVHGKGKPDSISSQEHSKNANEVRRSCLSKFRNHTSNKQETERSVVDKLSGLKNVKFNSFDNHITVNKKQTPCSPINSNRLTEGHKGRFQVKDYNGTGTKQTSDPHQFPAVDITIAEPGVSAKPEFVQIAGHGNDEDIRKLKTSPTDYLKSIELCSQSHPAVANHQEEFGKSTEEFKSTSSKDANGAGDVNKYGGSLKLVVEERIVDEVRNNDAHTISGCRVSNCARIPPQGPVTTTSECFYNALGCGHTGDTEHDRDREDENNNDTNHDYRKNGEGLDSGCTDEEYAGRQDSLAGNDQIGHSICDVDGIQKCENSDDESPLYDNHLDPDYLSITGYDVNYSESASNLKAHIERLDSHGQCKQVLHGSTYSTSSSMTSVSLPSLTHVDSDSMVSVAGLKSITPENLCPKDISHVDADREAIFMTRSLKEDGNNKAITSASDLNVKDSEHDIFRSASCGSSSQPRPEIFPTVSSVGDARVAAEIKSNRSVADSPTLCGGSPQKSPTMKSQGLPSRQPSETVATTASKEGVDSADFHIGLLHSPEANASSSSRRDNESSLEPPPPTPHDDKVEPSCSQDYLKSPSLSDCANSFIWRRDKLLSGLNAVAATSFYMPAFRLSDWQLSHASATVLKVYYCSQETAIPQYRVDKDGYRLNTVAPFTVFYRQDKYGFPVCLYTVQWFSRGLYSLRNRDITDSMEHLGVVKLGALLDHSFQSEPPSCEHYPLLVLGAPTASKGEALKEANLARFAAMQKCHIPTVMERLIGMSPRWAPLMLNRFVGPDNLSSCITTKRCGTEDAFCYQDAYLRKMLRENAEIPYLVELFQNIAFKGFSNTTSDQEVAVTTEESGALGNVHVRKKCLANAQNLRPISDFHWSVSTFGMAIPICSLRKETEKSGKKCRKLPSIINANFIFDTWRETPGESIPTKQNSGTTKSELDKKSWLWKRPISGSDIHEPEPTKLGVIGSKTSLARRTDLPPVKHTAREVHRLKAHPKAGYTHLEHLSGAGRSRPLSGRSLSSREVVSARNTGVDGGQLRGWEWRQTVLPPPFPDTLRRSKVVVHPLSKRGKNVRSFKTRPAIGRRRRRRKRSTSSSLKSCSSGPSTSSSSSEDEDPPLSVAIKNSFQQGQAPKKLEDIFGQIFQDPKVPFKMKKIMKARKQREKEEEEEEKRILHGGGGGAGGEESKTLPLPVMTLTARHSSYPGGEALELSEYDMLSDVEEAKEAWANSFPAVRYSNKKKRWCKAKQTGRANKYAKAAVMMGLGSLV